jgi:hypothetical protein
MDDFKFCPFCTDMNIYGLIRRLSSLLENLYNKYKEALKRFQNTKRGV